MREKQLDAEWDTPAPPLCRDSDGTTPIADAIVGIIRLRRRTWLERVILAPRHFWKIAAVGRGLVPMWARLHSAFVLTRHLLRRNP